MRVTGTLSPDVTGDFIRGADYDGHHTWTLSGGGWSLWYYATPDSYFITPIIGTVPEETAPYWIHSDLGFHPAGSYSAHGTATGTPTVTSI